jgi:uncharacterized protein (TIGR00297 family)
MLGITRVSKFVEESGFLNCRDRGWMRRLVGAWCLSWPPRRARQGGKHKAPTQPLYHPLSLRRRGPLPTKPPCAGTKGKSKRFLAGLLFSSSIALLAYRSHSLNKSGAVGAIASGTTILGMGGWPWGLSLVYFFVSSSLLSHFRKRDKLRTAADKFSKGSQRDIAQVVANGGGATLMALTYGLTHHPLLQAGFAGTLATATADTWATELGVLSPSQPRLITTGERVPTGTSGGITLPGTSSAALGGLSLGLIFWAGEGFRKSLASLPLIALVSGLAGSFFDSLLGATVQAMYYCPNCDKETERRTHSCGTKTQPLRGISWINNDMVNFLATLFGGLVAMGLQRNMNRAR